MEQLIRNGLEAMDLLPQTPDRAPAQLAEYGRLLLEKNQVMNLTAITEPERVAQLHMLDSAALLKGADFQDKTLIDVGTGAGFPGIPLKILVPSLQVTLLDSLNKRVDWLGQVCAQLGLEASGPSTPGRRSRPWSRAFGTASTLPPPAQWLTCACCVSCVCPTSRWAGCSWP